MDKARIAMIINREVGNIKEALGGSVLRNGRVAACLRILQDLSDTLDEDNKEINPDTGLPYGIKRVIM